MTETTTDAAQAASEAPSAPADQQPEQHPDDVGVLELAVEDGALTEVPCYESHKRGKNWLAIIHSDPTAPNGLGRQFCDRGRGKYYYMADKLAPGLAVEFGADYYTGGGRPSRERVYGVVLSVAPDLVRIRVVKTHETAVVFSKQMRADLNSYEARRAALEADAADLRQKLAAAEAELAKMGG